MCILHLSFLKGWLGAFFLLRFLGRLPGEDHHAWAEVVGGTRARPARVDLGDGVATSLHSFMHDVSVIICGRVVIIVLAAPS